MVFQKNWTNQPIVDNIGAIWSNWGETPDQEQALKLNEYHITIAHAEYDIPQDQEEALLWDPILTLANQ